ncbi:hypothetical protein QNH46_13440 [Paenibacillus woosongensis]|uniref:Regulatory protein YrvL n=1 Tax=Paenibacillus woosongensis TaxID=307580 RepID=A0AA95HZY5_9BACL|nr:hypothetical protein [Paenibacillus woosongensis]WHX47175.1 hypothetical protein QNH46_13440 [Paenibacillus woosongensis]
MDRREHDEPVPWQVRLWLVPLLSLLILAPIIGFAFLYSLFFYSFSEISSIMDYEQYPDLLVFSIYIIVGFLIFETLINPLIIAVIRYILNRQISVYAKNAITIIADSIIIYLLAGLFKGIFIESIWAALSVSVFYHVFEWIMIWALVHFKKKD